MNKKHRDIVVNDVTYGYIVKGDGKGRNIRIYRDKKLVYGSTWRVATVTPALIEEIIIKLKL